jgi:hypothetical protein
MRALWILPNRDQRDDILVCDGGKTLLLREVLDPKLRPMGFSHGVPAELLEKYGDRGGILFAQKFPGWNGRQQLFTVSTPAGVDASGRVVHLGLLFVLEPHELPRFDIPHAGLSEEDRRGAAALVHRMTSQEPGDLWAQSVRELGRTPANRPITNVALERSAVRFDSLYTAGPDGLSRKPGLLRRWPAAIVVLILCAAAGAGLEHSCEQSGRTAAQTGVSIWHLS